MGQVMGMFAKDLATNILFVLTFADFKEPNVKASLEKQFTQIIEGIKKKNNEWLIKVNNSAMFQKVNSSDPIDVGFYEMGSRSLEKTIERMYASPKVPIKMTLDVLKKR